MKIAYIAPYQGADLLRNRPCLHNLSLAARVKIQLLAELLQSSSHDVEIISPGAVNIGQLRFYQSFSESNLFDPRIPIDYLSALPIKFLRGLWEGIGARRALKSKDKPQHRYDAIIICTLGNAQIWSARYAIRRGVPVILEYEDDAFVDVRGNPGSGLSSNGQRVGPISQYHRRVFRKMLDSVSGVIAPSPYLLSQCSPNIPRLLVRAVVSREILRFRREGNVPKKNWVAFSGTHEMAQGLEQMVRAWRMLRTPEWELHIAGQGTLTPSLEKAAEGDRSIVFHGLLDREENARLLCAAKIGMNPQDVSRIPGTSFAFKIIEYLAAGAHVITTPRGALEPELEAGVTYISDNSPETIAASLKKAIQDYTSAGDAEQAAVRIYGPEAVSIALNKLLIQAAALAGKECLQALPTKS